MMKTPNFFFWLIVVLLAFALGLIFVAVSEGQEPHQALNPSVNVPWMSRTEAIDASRFVLTRTMDPISTWRALSHGAKEEQLPSSLVENHPGFMAYSLGIAGGEILLEHKLDRTRYYHEHKWFRITERIGIEASIGLMARTDIHNWSQHK